MFIFIPSSKWSTSTQNKLFWGAVQPVKLGRLSLAIDSMQHINQQIMSCFVIFNRLKYGFGMHEKAQLPTIRLHLHFCCMQSIRVTTTKVLIIIHAFIGSLITLSAHVH